MDRTTLQALASFPEQLKAHYLTIPTDYVHWTPPSWDGIPSEHFTAIEQVCHVRDIEIDGYQVRIERVLQESNPTLASINSEAVAVERSYGTQNALDALQTFERARSKTLAIISELTPAQLARPATFEGYGQLTLRGLVHYLCSHDQQHLSGLQWLLGQIDAVSTLG